MNLENQSGYVDLTEIAVAAALLIVVALIVWSYVG